ncbi:MAG: ABC transporter ATP-binding protein [Lachnospiraceae bacterium]|nr:ABC transporter ATP-binding protein [Lachnospiraceae bacterium]MBR6486244.1 ABC transporter ATP-binding protein [Lachnospiraceae bacterium]
MEETKTIIRLDGVRKSYDGKVNVIEDLSLDINEGEFVTLLGPSGCGKTTILRMIGGFDKPTEGRIMLDDNDISLLPPNERPVNTVFQKYALFPHLNVYDNIAFGLKLLKKPKDEIDSKVKKVLELVDLEGFEKRSVSTLSGGQQQRIAIARAVVNEPRVLLLDECLSALDYKMRKEMQLELKSMHKRLGITFIFVTHDQEEALTMSDKIVVLADGKVQQVGTPEEIYNEPANVFVADFIGESNIFNGVMSGRKKAAFAGTEFECVDDYEPGKKIEAVIRPEDVTVVGAGQGQLTGEVTSADFKGTFYITFVQCGQYEMEVHCLEHYRPGTTVGLNVLPDNIHIIPYDMTINNFYGIIDGFVDGKGLYLVFKDFSMFVDQHRLYPQSRVSKGRLLDENGEHIDYQGREVIAFYQPEDGDMSDDAKEGDVVGKIVSFYYIGDHYSYTIRTDSELDYVVDDEDLWNQDDKVSVILPKDKMKFRLRQEEAD